MLTQTTSTDDEQPIKNVLIESASNYLQFVKMTEHAMTPTREWAGYAGITLRSPYHTTVPAGGKKLYRPTCKLNYRKGTTAESLR